jgi:rhodanese-related sulfurtransferase
LPNRILPETLRAYWRSRDEIALLDVREEAAYAEAHPFFAVSLPLSRLELDIFARVPRKSAPLVVYDDNEGLAERAAACLGDLGYTSVAILEGGLTAYARHGELFRDVNVPSKAFGELVEAIRHTPSLPADEVAALIAADTDIIVLDARRFEEYQITSIPHALSVPGGELVRRIDDLVPSDDTTVIVNCAGRTRSILGAQSLLNAGLANRVVALRNGTIGWTLAGRALDHGQTRRYGDATTQQGLERARARAAAWADRVGVRAIASALLDVWLAEANSRTLYRLDVRSPQEYERGHPTGFISAPGGQLVQALDEWVAVRGARLVLFDDDGVRARMAASWLVQMGWEAVVIGPGDLSQDESGVPAPPRPDRPAIGGAGITPQALAGSLKSFAILDLSPSPIYRKGHIPGSKFIIRSRIAADLAKLGRGSDIVLTSPDGDLAAFALAEAAIAAAGVPVRVLLGGTVGWRAAGQALTSDEAAWLSPAEDVYKRPYEGTDNSAGAMQAYIDWELRLVAQLANDGVCNFRVV